MIHKLHPDVLRVELRYHIDNASDYELNNLYTFIDSKTPPYEWCNDEEFDAELDRRSADLESGKERGISREDLKKSLLSRHKKLDITFDNDNLDL